MATSTLEFDCPDGESLFAQLTALASDTILITASGTERTNDKGSYTCSIVDIASGTYKLRIKDAANNTISRGLLQHTNAAVNERPADVDWASIAVPSATVDLSATTIGVVADIDASDVWGYATRTLTQTAAEVADVMAGSTITITRGDTTTITLTGLGNISARTTPKLWFTVKTAQNILDASAVIQLTEIDGLLVLNGDSTSSSLASLTVTDATAGNITIVLSATLTAALALNNSMYYDIQMLASGTVTTLTSGIAKVVYDVTRNIA